MPNRVYPKIPSSSNGQLSQLASPVQRQWRQTHPPHIRSCWKHLRNQGGVWNRQFYMHIYCIQNIDIHTYAYTYTYRRACIRSIQIPNIMNMYTYNIRHICTYLYTYIYNHIHIHVLDRYAMAARNELLRLRLRSRQATEQGLLQGFDEEVKGIQDGGA